MAEIEQKLCLPIVEKRALQFKYIFNLVETKGPDRVSIITNLHLRCIQARGQDFLRGGAIQRGDRPNDARGQSF